MSLRPASLLPMLIALVICLAGPAGRGGSPPADDPAVPLDELLAAAGLDDPRRAIFLFQPIDINLAGPLELASLEGIGPALAERIVERRESRGPFGDVRELLEVRGIGEGKLALIVDRVMVSK